MKFRRKAQKQVDQDNHEDSNTIYNTALSNHRKITVFYSQLNHLQWRVRDLVQVSAPLLPVLQQAEEHGSEGFVRRALRDFLVHVKKKDGTHF